MAATPEQVYSSVDADTVLTVLTHKITRAVRAQVMINNSRSRSTFTRSTAQHVVADYACSVINLHSTHTA